MASKLTWFLCAGSKLTVSVLPSPQSVLSTQRHRYTQCPCWFIPERFKFCGHRLWDREKPKQPHQSRQSKRNASVPGTRTQQNKPDQNNIKKGTEKTKKPTEVLKNVMQEDQKGCKKINIRLEERGPILPYFECDDRLTWLLCGWWSKLTRFLDAGGTSLGFTVSIEIELVLSGWSILTSFQCEGLNLIWFQFSERNWFVLCLGV